MAFWHIPLLFNAALSNEALHIFEHLTLLIGGTIFWWPILSPLPECRLRPVPQGVAYLFTSCLACTSLGVLITFAPELLYPAYAQPFDTFGILPVVRDRWGISPAMDQQIGGLLMWVPGCLVYLTAIMAMFARWYGEEPKNSSMEATCGGAMDLNRDAFEPPLPAGWKKPLPEHLPRRTYWPAILALAMTLSAAGASNTDASHGGWVGAGSSRVGWMDRRHIR